MQLLPAAMAACRQFILYRKAPSATRPGKTDKFPVDWRTGAVCSAHDPAVWLDAQTAATLPPVWGADHGVGFVFTAADPFWFLDIDDCLQADGQWSPLAQQLVAAFPGAAVEVSQSGRGLHVFGSGTVPPHRCKHTALGLELYHTERFVALTGTHLSGDAATDHTAALEWLVRTYFDPGQAPAAGADGWREGPVPEWSGPTDDDELIARAMRHTSAASAFGGTRASFRDLWTGDTDALGRAFPDVGGRPFDASGADAALASHLAYYTGNDHERMQRLMLRSGLVRDKWEQRPEYLRGTITYSAGRTTRWLNDRPVALGVPPAGTSLQTDTRAAIAGVLPATPLAIFDRLRAPDWPYRLEFDDFLGRVLITLDGQTKRPLVDADYGLFERTFEAIGFKPPKMEILKRQMHDAAWSNRFDSLHDWVSGLAWDGTPRVAAAMVRYFGAAPGAYAEAVGRYLFTALAGRALDPGCQADMAIILIDTQGTRKTSGVAALAPTPEAFGEVDLSKIDDDNTSRKLRGKVVCELAELRGLAGRDDESIKAWVSRRRERWIEKWQVHETDYPRRCVLIGTGNRDDILRDPTGNRRWLPLRSGAVDAEALERDRDQLWAEGVAMWRAEGIAWQESESLAKDEHDAFLWQDVWEEPIRNWLARPPIAGPGEVPSPLPNGQRPFHLHEVMQGALGIPVERQKGNETRVSAVLKRVGYVRGKQQRVDGRVVRRWVLIDERENSA